MLEVACTHCGARSSGLAERCSACGSFGTLVEGMPAARRRAGGSMARPAAEVEHARIVYLRPAGVPWWDAALPRGLAIGSTVTVFGPEGSGKTSHVGAIATRLAKARSRRARLFSAEQDSVAAVLAVARIEKDLRALDVAGMERGAGNLERCIAEVRAEEPLVVVYDSAQTFEAAGAWPGSDRAVRAVVRAVKAAAQAGPHVAILLAQVNAAGRAAGPRKALHDVDAVMELLDDRFIVRKNRFGDRPCPVEVRR